MLIIDVVYVEGFLSNEEVIFKPAHSFICEVHEVCTLKIDSNGRHRLNEELFFKVCQSDCREVRNAKESIVLLKIVRDSEVDICELRKISLK